jgi:hypothetical protein
MNYNLEGGRKKTHTPYFMNLRDSNDAYQGVDCIYIKHNGRPSARV